MKTIRVMVTLNEGHLMLFDYLDSVDARWRATRLRSLAELGLRVERGQVSPGQLSELAAENTSPAKPKSSEPIGLTHHVARNFDMDL